MAMTTIRHTHEHDYNRLDILCDLLKKKL